MKTLNMKRLWKSFKQASLGPESRVNVFYFLIFFRSFEQRAAKAR